MKPYGLIYKVTNLVNGKVYIGQTTRTLKERKQQHLNDTKYEIDNVAFHKAIRKYGALNFEWEQIDVANSKEELNELEMHYIAEYNSFVNADESNGYNMTFGGEGVNAKTLDQIARVRNRAFGNDRTPLYAYSIETDETIYAESIGQMATFIEGATPQHICDCLKDRKQTCLGYEFEYAKNIEAKTDYFLKLWAYEQTF